MNRTNRASLPPQTSWHGGEILKAESANQQQVHWWWHRLATPSEKDTSTAVKRDLNRRARLLSIIVFYLILIDLILIPATLFIPNHYVVFLCLFVLLVSIITVICNRAGKVLFASFLLVAMLEVALIAITASTLPFDIGNLPLYDLLALSVLFAASLLPANFIFVTAVFNIIFIVGELVLQKNRAGFATSALHLYLQTQFYAALARPVVLQIIIGAVIFLWVRSTSQAIARAERAEMIAQLEHMLAKQKDQLEAGVQEILRIHSEVANGNLEARVPATRDNSLWPLASALNTLLTRFQRAIMAEQQLQQGQKTLSSLLKAVQIAEQTQQPLPQFPRSSTSIDPLLVALSGKKITR